MAIFLLLDYNKMVQFIYQQAQVNIIITTVYIFFKYSYIYWTQECPASFVIESFVFRISLWKQIDLQNHYVQLLRSLWNFKKVPTNLVTLPLYSYQSIWHSHQQGARIMDWYMHTYMLHLQILIHPSCLKMYVLGIVLLVWKIAWAEPWWREVERQTAAIRLMMYVSPLSSINRRNIITISRNDNSNTTLSLLFLIFLLIM